MNVLTNLWGILIVMPFVGFVLVYLLIYRWKKDRRQAVKWSINITNILLMEAVVVTYALIWPEAWSAWLWLVLLFILLATLLGWMQVKLRGKLSLSRIGVSTWRISFVILSAAYVFLVVTGIWKYLQVS